MEETVLAVTRISRNLGKEGVIEGANGEEDERLMTAGELESPWKEDTERDRGQTYSRDRIRQISKEKEGNWWKPRPR